MNWKHRAGALLLALAMALSLALPAAASGGGVTVTVGPNTLDLCVGGSDGEGYVTAVTSPTADVTWSSGDTGVATVDRNGAVTAVGAGSTNITATATAPDGSTGTGSCAVNVRQLDIQGQRTVEAGEPVTITARLLPAGSGSLANVTWAPSSVVAPNASDNGRSATFTYTGEIDRATAVEVTATGTTNDGKTVRTTIEITVEPKTVTDPEEVPARGISINQTTPQYVNREASVLLTASTVPSNATDPVTWEVTSGSGVVQLRPDEENDHRCTVVGRNVGAATIVARAGEAVSSSFVVEVSGLILEPTEIELFENGDPATLTVSRYGAAREMQLFWESQSEPIASVSSGKVYPNSVGTAEITAYVGNHKNYTAVCKVTVKENVAGIIQRSVSGGRNLSLSDVTGDLRSRCLEMTEDSLRLVRGISVSPSAGILHYNYVSPEFPGQGVGNETYYLSPSSSLDRDLSKITFAPKIGFSGDADIYYTGESMEGKTFSGIIRVHVADTGDVTYSTASNLPVTFQAEDFTAVCRPRTGQEVRYVSFQQPTSGRGTLYRTYSAAAQYNAPVTASDKFYRTSNPKLDEVTFLPEENAAGTVKIPYLCTTNSGGSYTGTVTINVYNASEEGQSGDVNYTVSPGGHVTLRASDFNNVSLDATGNNLDYVYFDLPAASRGTLYLNYRSASNNGSRVQEDTRYYRSSSPRIDNITFVPASGFTGSVAIPFTAFDRRGESFKGGLVIRVTEDDNVIRYTTAENRAVSLDGQDFNEACQRVNGASLDYITFDTPSTSRGRLYRNYRSSSSTGSSIGDATRVYYRGSPAISDITFVPARNYNGTVSIPLSGYDSDGQEYTGTLEITVGTGSSSDDVVSYSTTSGGLVSFSASDFDAACQAITGRRLNYVRFSLPASRYGTLYYQYNSSRDTGTSVSTSTSYYRTGSGRLLDSVSFLAGGGASGTVSFDYTGWSEAGRQFTGTVEITISSPQSQVIRYTAGSGQIALQTADFRSACTASTGGTLSYIRFNSLPAGGAGQLLAEGNYVSTGASYYADGSSPAIGSLRFTPASGYRGVVQLSYTGWDTRGRSHIGTVEITVANSAVFVPSSPFTDLGSYNQEFVTAINYLYNGGVVGGYGDGRFGPRQPVTRGAFTLMLCRAFNLNTGSTSSFPDVPAGSVYGWAVATARDLGIAQGSNGRFNPASPITRQAAMTMICRAMRAAGREVPSVSVSVLSSYADNGQVSDYARASLASLVYMDAVRGDAYGRLNPTQSISRAEMAVILYRVLTTS